MRIAGVEIGIYHRAEYDTDLTIGYLGGVPVLVDEEQQGYAAAPEGARILTSGRDYVWYVEAGRWHNSHRSNWPDGQPTGLTDPAALDWEYGS